ncbi:N-6 DNA methylase [Photorhabdus temperata]|uniref:Type I restriction-modification system methyltransferase subunit n=1 Tax=Photorhabdus temperata subsp. temperata Meg1 TaxID=1393735 RepID=A0A081S065_PHOTE|nr:N-6 DNA methylase [Photorhabdus temperata]KER04318.1 type I restriction-modification system methyltransferase subunit [Photorhabdus temperata subsp. temperata Meg1]MCT8346329.1 N-6 DNA methylase [Photorhabdus temperata]
MIDFNQYYTSKDVSDLLTSFITFDNPKTCLELSAGEGALLHALRKRWINLHFTTIEIDPVNHKVLKDNFPYSTHFCVDATEENCKTLLGNKFFDLAVCNPPFEYINTNENIRFFLGTILGDKFGKLKKIRAEMFFLAINLFFLKRNGILAIIVPELLIEGVKFRDFREAVFTNNTLQYLIEFKHKSFKKTEAKTYILVIKKEKANSNYCFNAIKVGSDFGIAESNTSVINSLYNNIEFGKKLYSNKFLIIRGNISGKECKKISEAYIHTTTMSDDLCYIYLPKIKIYGNVRKTIEGDIIISRVGTRVLGKTNIVAVGEAIVSDCVFCIRFFNSNDRITFLNFWKKNRKSWLTENATGTCAMHITKEKMFKLIESLL